MHEFDPYRFDLNLLVVFEALIRERHVGRAGERLGLTQPAVSHALGRLRKLLDDPLFVRHAKGMRPTPRAEALADVIVPAIRVLRTSLQREKAFVPANARRTIAIGASDYINLILVPPLLARLREAAPNIDIRLRSITRESVLQDLRSQTIDLAIGPLEAAHAAMELTPLFSEQLVLIARAGHPDLHNELTMQRFSTLPHLLVSPGGDAFGSVDLALRQNGFSRRIVVTVPHFLTAPFIAGATDLVAVIASRVAQQLAPAANVSIYPLPVTIPPWTVGLARLRDAPADPAIEWLTKLIAAVTREV